MDKHFITFSIVNSSYCAYLIFHLYDCPTLVEVTHLYPEEYKPKLPYLFIASKEKRLLIWPVECKDDADLSEAIAGKFIRNLRS